LRYTTTYNHILQATKKNKRFVINQGGTSSGKTYATLQFLFVYAMSHPDLLISVVAESVPHLKRGALRDFLNIVKGCGHYKKEYYNKSSSTYTLESGTVIEFFSADDDAKLRGARRDILYINECNNVSYEAFQQLEVRTKKRVYLDFNPVSSFWVHDKVLIFDNAQLIKTTYRDNEFLDEQIIKSIERRKDLDPMWWRVYGMGEVGMLEGLIFKNFHICDDMPLPDDFKWICIGLDWGFTNDPTAIVEVGLAHGELYINEVIYETGLTNQDIAEKMAKENIDRRMEIIADSAEPKSIQEVRRMGFNIKPTTKGKDSIINGIDILKRYKLNITKTSINVLKEFRNYQWQQTKDGDYINKPIDFYNHALDAIRYVGLMKIGNRRSTRASSI
jgi:phage terminase large subunit